MALLALRLSLNLQSHQSEEQKVEMYGKISAQKRGSNFSFVRKISVPVGSYRRLLSESWVPRQGAWPRRGWLSPGKVAIEGATLAIKRDQMSKFPSNSNSMANAIPAWEILCKFVSFSQKYSSTLKSFLCLLTLWGSQIWFKGTVGCVLEAPRGMRVTS